MVFGRRQRPALASGDGGSEASQQEPPPPAPPAPPTPMQPPAGESTLTLPRTDSELTADEEEGLAVGAAGISSSSVAHVPGDGDGDDKTTGRRAEDAFQRGGEEPSLAEKGAKRDEMGGGGGIPVTEGGNGDDDDHGPAPPDLADRPKSLSLPTVLRSSYKGDWRVFLRRMARRAGRGRQSDDRGDFSDDEDDTDGPKGPPSMISMVSSMHTSVHSFIQTLEDRLHHMPKWQYRLLVGSVVFLLASLVILTVVTVMYGFGMAFPHIEVTQVDLALPFPHLDRDGSIPIEASVAFNNPNSFPIRTEASTIQVYTMPGRTPDTLLGSTGVPSFSMAPHGENYAASSILRIKDVTHVKGGQGVVNAMLNQQPSYLYTRSTINIVVKSLGFLPIRRTFRTDCKILKLWGAADPPVLLSDCYGRFTKGSAKVPGSH